MNIITGHDGLYQWFIYAQHKENKLRKQITQPQQFDRYNILVGDVLTSGLLKTKTTTMTTMNFHAAAFCWRRCLCKPQSTCTRDGLRRIWSTSSPKVTRRAQLRSLYTLSVARKLVLSLLQCRRLLATLELWTYRRPSQHCIVKQQQLVYSS